MEFFRKFRDASRDLFLTWRKGDLERQIENISTVLRNQDDPELQKNLYYLESKLQSIKDYLDIKNR